METMTKVSDITETIDKIINFIKTDERVKHDFVQYLKTAGVYNLPESKQRAYYLSYIFERSLPIEEITPLKLYNKTNSTDITLAMINNFSSIFEIKRILKSGFEAYNIVNEKSYTLNITSKMTDYRGYGVGQYIVARVFELKKEHYILEITGHLASNKKEEVMRYAMLKILQEPYLVYEDNPKKHKSIKNNIQKMYDKFISAFGTNELITTNIYVDDIIEQYNNFSPKKNNIDISDKLTVPEDLKYFEIEDLQNNYSNFIENSLSGFSTHKKHYDVGIIYDKEYGLYIIPFYKTLLKILEENSLTNTENAEECIRHFVTSETIPANIIEYINTKYPNFVDLINKVMHTDLTLSEILSKYKSKYMEHEIYSKTTTLYNSDIFNNTVGFVAEHQSKADIDYSNVKRNDPCPCGSGKKFKNCCLNNI
ncbi:SEC-C domain-containing protein [bacterium]|nr:SEC-C domain-containing protein [bacterium]